MFKNMKLSMKMFTGFGVLIVITTILSGTSWYVLHNVEEISNTASESNDGILHIQELRQLEKDFLANGFETAEGQSENSADRWAKAARELDAQMAKLEAIDSLHQEDVAVISQTKSSINSYGQSFEKLTASRKQKDEAFASWGQLGWDITNSINDAKDQVINPALAKAHEEKNLEQIEQWSQIKTALNEDFIQNFLVLRICGIYLVATDKDAQWESLNKQLTKTIAGLDTWTDTVKGNAKLEASASGIKASLTAYEDAAKKYYSAIKTQRTAISDMIANAQKAVEGLETLRTNLDEEVDSFTAMANTLSIGLTIFGVVTGCLLAFFITRSIVKPINQIIADLSEGAAQVSSASTQVSSASQSLAEGATEQAAGLEETSSSLEEMSSMTKQNADNAQQANVLSNETSTSANDGARSMERMSSAIEEIRKSSDETAKIIKVIDEIAFQTNLLALNAAVEAARAGEAGKGFAVVAEEVRNLAIRSAEAAKNTSALIEESVRNSQNGVEISEEVTKVFADIVSKIEKTSNLVGEIAAASSEQAQGIDQVNTAVAQMDKVTQQNAANAEESASASEELNSQAEQMNHVVQRLAALVSGGTVDDTAGGHPGARLGRSDELYHQIAKAPAGSKAVAHHEMSGFDDF